MKEEARKFNFKEDFTKEEVETLLSILPKDFLIDHISKNAKAFKEEVGGFRPSHLPMDKLLNAFYTKLVKQETIPTISFISAILTKTIELINKEASVEEKDISKIVKDKEKTLDNFLEKLLDSYFKNHIDLYFKLLLVTLTEEDKVYIQNRKITLLELVEFKKELKKESDRKIKEAIGEVEINNQKLLKQKKEEITILQSGLKNLEIDFEENNNILSIKLKRVDELSLEVEELNELVRDKNQKILKLENLLNDKSKKLEESIEKKWKEENQEKELTFLKRIEELKEDERTISKRVDILKKEKNVLDLDLSKYSFKKNEMESDISFLENKSGLFLEKFNKLFSNKTSENQSFSDNYFIYPSEINNCIENELEEITEVDNFIEDLSYNFEVSGIQRDYSADLAEYIFSTFSNKMNPFLIGYNTNYIAHAFSYLVCGEKAEIINLNPGFSNSSHLIDIINKSNSKVILIENILNSVSENVYLSLLKMNLNKFIFFSLESSETISLLPEFLKNYFLFINIDNIATVPTANDYYFAMINESIFKGNNDIEKTMKYYNKIKKTKILNNIGNIKCSEIFSILDTDFNRDFNDMLKNLIIFSKDSFDFSKYENFSTFVDTLRLEDSFKDEIKNILGVENV